MKNNTITGIALLLTIVALTTFAFIALLGLEYLFRGLHALVIPLLVAGVCALSYCIYLMCVSKASRNKRSGRPREVLAIAGAAALLYAGSIPFTQFLYVHDHRQELISDLSTTVGYVESIDSAYLSYAQQRIKDYKSLVKKEKFSKQKREALVASLTRRLLPANRDSVCAERQEWVSSIGVPSVWSLSTPRNLSRIVEAGEEWTKQYQQISAVIYKGEKHEMFGDGDIALPKEQVESNEKSTTEAVLPYTQSLRRFFVRQKPDYRSLLIATVCCLLILTTYFHIRRPKNRVELRT